MKKEISICNITAKQGEKAQGFINILDTETKMPITIINGQKEGKTVLITAGVHGCEYPGIRTAIELSQEIDPKEVSGNIIIVHLVNMEGFEQRRAAVMPQDNKNILRVFPGDENGTISDKIAYVITNELISKADYYFDIHGGDLHEELIPHIYYPAKAKKEVVNKCKEIAKHFNVGYYAPSNNINGTFTSAAVNKDIPSLLIERGGCGLCQEEEVNLYKDDILNVLSVLNVIEYKRCHKDFTPEEIKYAIYLDAVKDGCWTCFVDAGQSVKKGDKLGVISDYFGNIIDTYYAEFDSTVLYNTVAYSVPKGSSLVAYGRV